MQRKEGGKETRAWKKRRKEDDGLNNKANSCNFFQEDEEGAMMWFLRIE